MIIFCNEDKKNTYNAFIDTFFKVAGITLEDYTAPDWVFEIPNINIQCAGATNQDILGLCSGDVLGNNPDPNY